MIILPYREKFIQDNFIEYSFKSEDENYLPDFKLFESLNSTEQFYLAENFNWDDGVTVMSWIIESKKCDKGTASLIFWKAEPDFYFEKTENEIPDYEKDTFLLLKRIVEKFNKKEFKKSNLKYNPKDRENRIDWSRQNFEWNIPQELKESTRGFSIISLGIIQQKIWQWQRRRKEAKRAKKRLHKKK